MLLQKGFKEKNSTKKVKLPFLEGLLSVKRKSGVKLFVPDIFDDILNNSFVVRVGFDKAFYLF